jgi:predicted Zn finger-like uncharacterized protein
MKTDQNVHVFYTCPACGAAAIIVAPQAPAPGTKRTCGHCGKEMAESAPPKQK